MLVIESLKDVVNCNMGQFFIFKNNLITEIDKKNISIQKTVIDGKYIDVISLTETEI
jgi:hypothetical protein